MANGRALAIVAARRDETDGLDRAEEQPAAGTGVNEVHLVGRLGSTSQERTLPSGDTVLTFHVVVDRVAASRSSVRPRPGRAGTGRGDGVDALACAAWSARARRTLRTLEPGTWIEIEGALRRRFRRGAMPPVSFYEVEVAKLRRVR
jgi:single-strand DNA-binding protein